MGKARKRGVRKGMEATNWSTPTINRVGTYGSHRTNAMDTARENRLARIRSQRSERGNDGTTDDG